MRIVQFICKWVFQNKCKEQLPWPKMPSTIIHSSLYHVSWSFCKPANKTYGQRPPVMTRRFVFTGAQIQGMSRSGTQWHAIARGRALFQNGRVRTRGYAWIVFPWSLMHMICSNVEIEMSIIRDSLYSLMYMYCIISCWRKTGHIYWALYTTMQKHTLIMYRDEAHLFNLRLQATSLNKNQPTF